MKIRTQGIWWLTWGTAFVVSKVTSGPFGVLDSGCRVIKKHLVVEPKGTKISLRVSRILEK